MDNLTPKLDQKQLQGNIDALIKQQAPREAIQGYINNYTKTPDGFFVLKQQTNASVGTQEKPMEKTPDIVSDIKQFGGEVRETFGEAAQKVQEAKTATDQSKVRGIAQSLGITAGAVADTIGNAFKLAVKAPLSQNTENKIKSKIGEFAEKISDSPGMQDLQEVSKGFKNWYDNELTPAQQRDVDAFGGVAKLASEFVGVGTTKQVAKPAIEVTEQAFKNVSENVAKLTPLKIQKPSLSGFKIAGDIVKDVTPKAVDIGDRQIAKALNLSAVTDIARFKSVTGNDLGEFMARNDLIKDTTKETVEDLANFQKRNFEAKKDIVSLVEDKFTFEDAPEFAGLVDNLIKDLGKPKSPEFKQQVQILNDIKKSGEFDLSQMEYVKALSDDVNSFYNRTGDVRSGVQIKDQEALVNATRRFIEDIIAQKYPEVNIRELNRNTQSSRFILDTIAKNAGKGDTRSLASLGDYAVLGIGSNVAPGIGITALLGKKLIESAPIRLRIARQMYKKAGIKAGDKISKKELDEINKLIKKELDEIMGQATKKSKTKE